jgi:acyl carrier protein
MDVEKEIRSIVARKAEIEPDFDRKASFANDLGIDSLMGLEIISECEKKFVIKIPDDKRTAITSLDTAIALVSQLLHR